MKYFFKPSSLEFHSWKYDEASSFQDIESQLDNRRSGRVIVFGEDDTVWKGGFGRGVG